MTADPSPRDGPTPPGGRLVGAASLLAAGNVASRLLGLVREQVIAYLWGGSLEASAFSAAARVPTMLYDLLVGGMLSAALVPVLSSYAATRRDELWRAASVILSAAAAATGLAAIGVYAFAPAIASVLSSGYGPEGTALVAECLRYIAPAVLAFGVAGVLTGILFALERFALPAAAGAMYNLAFIVVAVCLSSRLGVYALPLGVSAGGLAQVLILVPGLRDGRLRLTATLRHSALRRVVVLYVPIAVGLVVTQGQVALDTRLASRAGAEALSWMRYGTNLIQFPHGLVAVAISLAILPRLAASHARQEIGAFTDVLARALRMVIALSIPAAVGLAVLATPVVGAVFQRGAFHDADRLAVTVALMGYLVGLPFAAIDWPLNYAYYARQNTLTPALVGIGAVGAYVVVAVLLGPVVNLLGLRADRVFAGLVVADSAKQMFHALVMTALTRRSLGPPAVARVRRTLLAALSAAAVMAVAVIVVDRAAAATVPPGGLGWLLRAAVGVLVGLAVYVPLAHRFGIDELIWLSSVLRQRLRPRDAAAPSDGPANAGGG